MKAIRPSLSLVIAMSLAPMAGAQAPATDTPIVTLEFSGDSLEEPLSNAFPGLDDPQSYKLDNPDILTKDGESIATLYTTVEPLCHVASLSSSQAIAQPCQTQTSKQVADWKRFFTELGKLLQPKTSSSITKEQWTSFDTQWATTLAPNDSKFYLIDSGKTFHLQTVRSLVQVVRAAAREAAGEVVKPGSFAPPLPVSFDPPCKFPATATGAKVTKLCSKSLPIPPFSATIEGDTLVLKRIEWKATQAFVSLTQRADTVTGQAKQETYNRRVLINLSAADNLTTIPGCTAGGKQYRHTASLNTLFRSAKVPFGSTCERVALTCNGGNWIERGRSINVSQFSRSCEVEKPKSCSFEGRTVAHGTRFTRYRASEAPVGERCQKLVRECNNGVMSGDATFLTCRDTRSCTLDGKTIKDKATVPAYQLKVVDSSSGQKCASMANMMRRTCTNGKLSDSNDWRSFRFLSCTARPMPKCQVNGESLTHGTTRSIYTSAIVPFGSTCDSVQKTAQCDEGQLKVDDTVVWKDSSWVAGYAGRCDDSNNFFITCEKDKCIDLRTATHYSRIDGRILQIAPNNTNTCEEIVYSPSDQYGDEGHISLRSYDTYKVVQCRDSNDLAYFVYNQCIYEGVYPFGKRHTLASEVSPKDPLGCLRPLAQEIRAKFPQDKTHLINGITDSYLANLFSGLFADTSHSKPETRKCSQEQALKTQQLAATEQTKNCPIPMPREGATEAERVAVMNEYYSCMSRVVTFASLSAPNFGASHVKKFRELTNLRETTKFKDSGSMWDLKVAATDVDWYVKSVGNPEDKSRTLLSLKNASVMTLGNPVLPSQDNSYVGSLTNPYASSLSDVLLNSCKVEDETIVNNDCYLLPFVPCGGLAKISPPREPSACVMPKADESPMPALLQFVNKSSRNVCINYMRLPQGIQPDINPDLNDAQPFLLQANDGLELALKNITPRLFYAPGKEEYCRTQFEEMRKVSGADELLQIAVGISDCSACNANKLRVIKAKVQPQFYERGLDYFVPMRVTSPDRSGEPTSVSVPVPSCDFSELLPTFYGKPELVRPKGYSTDQNQCSENNELSKRYGGFFTNVPESFQSNTASIKQVNSVVCAPPPSECTPENQEIANIAGVEYKYCEPKDKEKPGTEPTGGLEQCPQEEGEGCPDTMEIKDPSLVSTKKTLNEPPYQCVETTYIDPTCACRGAPGEQWNFTGTRFFNIDSEECEPLKECSETEFFDIFRARCRNPCPIEFPQNPNSFVNRYSRFDDGDVKYTCSCGAGEYVKDQVNGADTCVPKPQCKEDQVRRWKDDKPGTELVCDSRCPTNSTFSNDGGSKGCYCNSGYYAQSGSCVAIPYCPETEYFDPETGCTAITCSEGTLIPDSIVEFGGLKLYKCCPDSYVIQGGECVDQYCEYNDPNQYDHYQEPSSDESSYSSEQSSYSSVDNDPCPDKSNSNSSGGGNRRIQGHKDQEGDPELGSRTTSGSPGEPPQAKPGSGQENNPGFPQTELLNPIDGIPSEPNLAPSIAGIAGIDLDNLFNPEAPDFGPEKWGEFVEELLGPSNPAELESITGSDEFIDKLKGLLKAQQEISNGRWETLHFSDEQQERLNNFYRQAHAIESWLREQRSSKKYSERSILEAATLVRELTRNAASLEAGLADNDLNAIFGIKDFSGDVAEAGALMLLSSRLLGKSKVTDAMYLGRAAYVGHKLTFTAQLLAETWGNPGEFSERYAHEKPLVEEGARTTGYFTAGAVLGFSLLSPGGRLVGISPETIRKVSGGLAGTFGVLDKGETVTEVVAGFEMIRTGLSTSEGDPGTKGSVNEGIAKIIGAIGIGVRVDLPNLRGPWQQNALEHAPPPVHDDGSPVARAEMERRVPARPREPVPPGVNAITMDDIFKYVPVTDPAELQVFNRAITNIPAPPVELTKNQVGKWRQPDSRDPTGESYWGTMFGGPTAPFRVQQEFATRTGTKPEDWYLMKYRDKPADLEYHFGYNPVSGHIILHYFKK